MTEDTFWTKWPRKTRMVLALFYPSTNKKIWMHGCRSVQLCRGMWVNNVVGGSLLLEDADDPALS